MLPTAPLSSNAARNSIPIDRPTVNLPNKIILFLKYEKYSSGTSLCRIRDSTFLFRSKM